MRRFAILLHLVLLAGCAGVEHPAPPLADLVPVARRALPQVDLVLVDKSERTLTLMAGGKVLARFAAIQLGGEPVGPKRFQGDEKTPEGRYVIDYGNPASAYHLSLHISYPDPADTAFARRRGRSPGGEIFIHGQPNALVSGRVPGDWTDGCIALSNSEIEELWAIPDGTPIEIRP